MPVPFRCGLQRHAGDIEVQAVRVRRRAQGVPDGVYLGWCWWLLCGLAGAAHKIIRTVD